MNSEKLLKMNHLQSTKKKVCACCPYGYHIDIDFVQFVETFFKPDAKKSLSKSVRSSYKRKQCQPISSLLGLCPPNNAAEQTSFKPQIRNSQEHLKVLPKLSSPKQVTSLCEERGTVPLKYVYESWSDRTNKSAAAPQSKGNIKPEVKDVGVGCSVITRDVGSGHNLPKTNDAAVNTTTDIGKKQVRVTDDELVEKDVTKKSGALTLSRLLIFSENDSPSDSTADLRRKVSVETQTASNPMTHPNVADRREANTQTRVINVTNSSSMAKPKTRDASVMHKPTVKDASVSPVYKLTGSSGSSTLFYCDKCERNRVRNLEEKATQTTSDTQEAQKETTGRRPDDVPPANKINLELIEEGIDGLRFNNDRNAKPDTTISDDNGKISYKPAVSANSTDDNNYYYNYYNEDERSNLEKPDTVELTSALRYDNPKKLFRQDTYTLIPKLPTSSSSPSFKLHEDDVKKQVISISSLSTPTPTPPLPLLKNRADFSLIPISRAPLTPGRNDEASFITKLWSPSKPRKSETDLSKRTLTTRSLSPLKLAKNETNLSKRTSIIRQSSSPPLQRQIKSKDDPSKRRLLTKSATPSSQPIINQVSLSKPQCVPKSSLSPSPPTKNEDDLPKTTESANLSSVIRTGVSKEIKEAMKIVNISSNRPDKVSQSDLEEQNIEIVKQNWFKISSTYEADPHPVREYLNACAEISMRLTEYVLNMRDNAGNTALHYAISHGNFSVVSVLLDYKVCNVNAVNEAGYPCCMLVSLAQIKSTTERNVVRRLLQIADVNMKAKKHGQTTLMLAVSHGKYDIVQMLLDCGADVNIQDNDGSTALMFASEHGHLDIVHLLTSKKDCDLTIRDKDGNNALTIAMEAGYREIGIALYAKQHFSRMASSSGLQIEKRPRSANPILMGSNSTPPSPNFTRKYRL